MTKIYLLLQSQIIDLCEAGKIQEVVIERISLKQWYPIFDVKDENLGEVRCSIRLNKDHELRTWADLRLLTEFLLDKCNVDKCRLILKSTKER